MTATKGLVYLTFTPINGMSEVVRRFLTEESIDRHVTRMEISEAAHISDDDREMIINSYPALDAFKLPVYGYSRGFATRANPLPGGSNSCSIVRSRSF